MGKFGTGEVEQEQEDSFETDDLQLHEGEQETELETEQRDEREQIEQQIKDSKKTFGIFNLRDSGEMQRLKEGIDRQRAIMNTPVRLEKNGALNPEMVQSLLGSYDVLMGECQAYLEHIKQKGGGQRAQGKARVSLVTRLLAMLRTEKLAMEQVAATAVKQGGITAGSKCSDLLYMARAKKLDLGDVQEVGGGSSVVYKVHNEDETDSFLKKEESLGGQSFDDYFGDYEGEAGGWGAEVAAKIRQIHRAQPLSLSLWEDMQEYFKHRDGDKPSEQLVRDIVDWLHEQAGKPVYKAMRTTLEGIADVFENMRPPAGMADKKGNPVNDSMVKADMIMFCSKRVVTYEVATTARIRENSVMSNRNVSTSRLAEDLGAGNVIAKSETAVMEKDGQLARFNVMEGAKGMEMQQLLDEQQKFKKNLGVDVTIEYTPEALNQILKLQILDLVCGQVDRHKHNYFVTHEVDSKKPNIWRITSIKGIDNDLSWGELGTKDVEKGFKEALPITYKVQRKNGEVEKKTYLPFVEAEFFEALKAYKQSGMYKERQADLRTEAEIQKLGERIDTVIAEIEEGVKEERITIIPKSQIQERAVAAAKSNLAKNNRSNNDMKNYLIPKLLPQGI